MAHYLLHNKLRAKKGASEQLCAILVEASKLVTKIKECHSYLVSVDSSAPEDIWVTEIWDNKADHDASLQSNDVKTLITKAIPLLDAPPSQGQELKVIGGL